MDDLSPQCIQCGYNLTAPALFFAGPVGDIVYSGLGP
jgi:hypothetical protein